MTRQCWAVATPELWIHLDPLRVVILAVALWPLWCHFIAISTTDTNEESPADKQRSISWSYNVWGIMSWNLCVIILLPVPRQAPIAARTLYWQPWSNLKRATVAVSGFFRCLKQPVGMAAQTTIRLMLLLIASGNFTDRKIWNRRGDSFTVVTSRRHPASVRNSCESS